jgi:hypothetical protein
VAADGAQGTHQDIDAQTESTTAAAKLLPCLWNTDAPTDIRYRPSWLIWRFEHNPDGGKPRKVPYYSNGTRRSGEQGSPEDTRHLVPFTAARDAAIRMGYDGVGFATLEKWGVVAVDIDNCVEDGKIHADLQPLLGQTYSEFSPSGKGLRLFYAGNLGNGKDLMGDYGVELFSTKGFVTFTGNVVPGCELLGLENTVAAVSSELIDLHKGRFAQNETASPAPGNSDRLGWDVHQCWETVLKLDPELRYPDWIKVGMGLHHELGDEGFELWDGWSRDGSRYQGERDLRSHWRTFGRGSQAPITMRTVAQMAGVPINAPASVYEFDALVEAAEGKSDEKPARFVFEQAQEFASGPSPTWLIKHVLPDAELVVMFGASGSGKSFLALDMALAVARGVPWRGKRVRQGRVAYIAAEGAGGFRNRLKAYAIANEINLADIPLLVLNAAPNLLDKTDAAEVAAAIKSSGGASVVIVDTFAQVTAGGDENSGEDMGKALSHCKQIHRATGAVVLLVHHSGKDTSKGARGWSGVRAACDAELEVVREETGRYVRLSKQKDGEDDLRWGFDLEMVQLGVDEDLDPITSCVVIEGEIPTTRSRRSLRSNQKVVLGCFDSLESEGVVIGDDVINMAAGHLIKPVDARDTRRQNCKSALQRLCEGSNRWLTWGPGDVITRVEGDA